jgi:hypothetical protein
MIDRYTKSILTVIAVSLAIIAMRDILFLKNASAQSGPVPVILQSVDTYAFRFATVPVKIQN